MLYKCVYGCQYGKRVFDFESDVVYPLQCNLSVKVGYFLLKKQKDKYLVLRCIENHSNIYFTTTNKFIWSAKLDGMGILNNLIDIC